jgi:hypothetical protein
LDDKILRKYVRQYIDDIFVEFGVVRQILQKYHRYIVEHIFSIFYYPIFQKGICIKLMDSSCSFNTINIDQY